MQDIHAIRPPTPVGADLLILWIILGGVAGAGLICLICIGVRKWLKNRKGAADCPGLPNALPPYKVAMNSLTSLKSRRTENARIFYVDLTLVLRRYIDAKTGGHTAEMTSEEFKRALVSFNFNKEIKQEISRFLSATDPIKYSGRVAGQQQFDHDINTVTHMVETIETLFSQQDTESGEQP